MLVSGPPKDMRTESPSKVFPHQQTEKAININELYASHVSKPKKPLAAITKKERPLLPKFTGTQRKQEAKPRISRGPVITAPRPIQLPSKRSLTGQEDKLPTILKRPESTRTKVADKPISSRAFDNLTAASFSNPDELYEQLQSTSYNDATEKTASLSSLDLVLERIKSTLLAATPQIHRSYSPIGPMSPLSKCWAFTPVSGQPPLTNSVKKLLGEEKEVLPGIDTNVQMADLEDSLLHLTFPHYNYDFSHFHNLK